MQANPRCTHIENRAEVLESSLTLAVILSGGKENALAARFPGK